MNRRNRTLAAIFAVVAILFAHLAVSAHACGTVMQTVASHAAANQSCCDAAHGSDGQVNDLSVCLDHCQRDLRVLSEGEHLPNLAPVGNGWLHGIEVSSVADTADVDVSKGVEPLPQATPLAILYGVLRI